MKKNLWMALAVLMVTVSCAKKEAEQPQENPDTKEVTLSVSTVETKTALGNKIGDEWENLWKEDDKISVNGTESQALAAAYNDKKTAVFTVAASTPYYVAYPSTALSDYSAGTAQLTIPSEQNYVARSYDPAAFLMVGSSADASVSLNSAVGLLHYTITGSGTINRVTLESEAALSGTYETDFSGLGEAVKTSGSVSVNSASGVSLPADFFFCVPAGNIGDFTLIAYDNASGMMVKEGRLSKEVVAGNMYSGGSIAYEASPALTASLSTVTSSTASFTWTSRGVASYDIARPYTAAVYSDSSCETLVVSHDIPASDACWDSKKPKFIFGGLDAGETYYFRVQDTTNPSSPVNSNVVEFTTSAWTNVDASTVSDAAAGDVLLAEDFSELSWGPDWIGSAAGFAPETPSLVAPTGEDPAGSYLTSSSTEDACVLFRSATIGTDTRLSNGWGYGGDGGAWIESGYIRAAWGTVRNHIVTPKLAGIPDGKYARIRVTATVTKQNSGDVGIFVESGDFDEGTYKLSSISLTDGYALGVTSYSTWQNKSVVIDGVTNANRLAIGSYEDNGQNRFCLRDIKVELVSLSDIEASVVESTSSTITYTWTNGVSAADDIAKAYSITLYEDADGTTPVKDANDANISYSITANNACWNSLQPKFIFGGLTPSTTYYFKVQNTTSGTVSPIIRGTTQAFTHVQMPAAADFPASGVVLAEDFGEFCWGGDAVRKAAGPDHGNSGSSFMEKGTSFVASSGTERIFKNANFATARSSSRLADWCVSGVGYIHPGYIKLGSGDYFGYIVSPEFTVPDGKEAVIKVTITAAKFSGGYTTFATYVISDSTPGENNGITINSWPTSDQTTKYMQSDFDYYDAWMTKNPSGLVVKAGDRIAIGCRLMDSPTKSSARLNISDITVTVTALRDAE